ncbi:MAG: DUF6040 family protein [Suipraeoptans sp.]
MKIEMEIEEKENAIKVASEKISTREADVEKREKHAEDIVKNQEKKINEKAEKLTFDKRRRMGFAQSENEEKLRRSYKLKEGKLYALTMGGLLYSFLITVLTIVNTERFKEDFKAVIELIGWICLMIWNKVLVGANMVSDLCNKIPHEFVAIVLGWIAKVLFIVLILALIIGAIGWMINKLVEFYKSRFADRISAIISLITFSLLVWFGDYIGEIVKWNLLLVFLLIQVVYVSTRMYVEGCRS